MALVRGTFGRGRDAVRLLQRHHIHDLHKPTAKLFMIGQKTHKGEWRGFRFHEQNGLIAALGGVVRGRGRGRGRAHGRGRG